MEGGLGHLIQWGTCQVMFETLGVLCQHMLYILRRRKCWSFPNNAFWIDGPYLSGEKVDQLLEL